jgi:hypothetical protein
MNDGDFTTTITVDQSPDDVFAAINNVRGWWSEDLDGPTEELGDEFIFAYRDVHRCRQRITEMVPGKRVAWHVEEGYLSFTKDAGEWAGTDITFDISRVSDQTQIRFTHVGLRTESECFESCSNAWSFLINDSLWRLIATGTGQPLQSEHADVQA